MRLPQAAGLHSVVSWGERGGPDTLLGELAEANCNFPSRKREVFEIAIYFPLPYHSSPLYMPNVYLNIPFPVSLKGVWKSTLVCKLSESPVSRGQPCVSPGSCSTGFRIMPPLWKPGPP